ncbi:leucyl/phenylalanyl-tRNA--protein transferase [Roseisalinus antarcticus]|uniref:Leucyl/phenylalanyl-tRNA--protein transferase n=1 Tax=Roseisalinus antarcticus TaxID=254357 RepID=A0A1Y5U351_9RHOB|nr:leucyl/phenylalanyl-tRNA--protein transferase [Roseisalinus antarcticus]SLN76024.1 Leucyl/phenylalanyl-tRNA--protein transferase [Roseisalinus antarcticus]
MKDEHPTLTPELLLTAYGTGIFPMAERRGDPEIFWVDPRMRGVMPLDGFHISRSLARRIRRERYRVTTDRAFAAVVEGCADREETWINDTIFGLYDALHSSGHAHSLEVWSAEGDLVGGVYGVCLGAAFFGESMFSRATDASKIALAYMVDRLRIGGFRLFDTQFLTPHLASLGGAEISRRAYRVALADALRHTADFDAQGWSPSGQEVVQRSTQTS